MSNLTQIIFVVSCKHPKPDLLLLDKQLAFAEFLHIRPIIVLNKVDLDEKNEFENISNIYSKIGYAVIKTNAKDKEDMIADIVQSDFPVGEKTPRLLSLDA